MLLFPAQDVYGPREQWPLHSAMLFVFAVTASSVSSVMESHGPAQSDFRGSRTHPISGGPEKPE